MTLLPGFQTATTGATKNSKAKYYAVTHDRRANERKSRRFTDDKRVFSAVIGLMTALACYHQWDHR